LISSFGKVICSIIYYFLKVLLRFTPVSQNINGILSPGGTKYFYTVLSVDKWNKVFRNKEMNMSLHVAECKFESNYSLKLLFERNE
jgi:hypothetical protein